MSAPSWPQLVGWMATARITTARGRWRSVDEGVERTGTFAFVSPDRWGIRDQDGAKLMTDDEVPQRLWSIDDDAFTRGDDFHQPVDDVRAVEQAGRPCWAVGLVAPRPSKIGVLEVVVDDETGLRLRQSNGEMFVEEIVALELGVEVSDDEVWPSVTPRDEWYRLSELARERPVPTPRWLPNRRSWVPMPDCVMVAGLGRQEVGVSRAPLGTAAPVPRDASPHVVRLDHDGWSWAVMTPEPVDLVTALRIVHETLPAR